MKKYLKSIRLIPIIVSLILAIAIGLGGCITVNPPAAAPTTESPPTETATAPETASTITTAAILSGPAVPQEVLLLWKSEPASLASPADIQDKITLKPNTASGSTQVSGDISLSVIPAGTWQDSTSFHLEEGQWVDVIVSSVDIPIYFNWEEPGAVCLSAASWSVYDPNIYKLSVVNFDPDSPHYLTYSISLSSGDAPASLPLSADVNLSSYDEGEAEQFHNPEYSAATEGCIHAGPAISLSEGDTVRLTLESDCPIDWDWDWDNPKPQIGIIFPRMESYREDYGWYAICSGAIDVKSIVSSNEGRKLEIVLIPIENKVRTGFPQIAQKVGEPPSRDTEVFGPFRGKPLYENLVTITEEGTLFTTAARIFAWNGASDYWFVFYNLNRQKEAAITCRVYKLGATPSWGKSFWDAKMQPWLNDLYYMQVSGEISQKEHNQTEAKWLEQFR